ncbi:MAG: hypothetical protein LV481_09025 [Methylacidiphilales bacterium]|nr:hypothetical protein [Candidatus Methylacidiphilales bacterium]
MKRAWFKHLDWEIIVSINAGLCQSGNALHKPTTDGYEETRTFWIENYERELTLAEAVEICRRCHLLAPFCFYNGNTFVAIIRDSIAHAPGLSTQRITLAKSLAGHMVAGTAEPGEIAQFEQLLHDIEHGITTSETLQPGSYHIGDRVQTLKGTLNGVIIQINADGSIAWKCDQTGAEMTGTPDSLKAHPSK